MTELRALLAILAGEDEATRAHVLGRIPPGDLRALADDWAWGVHPGQAEPPGDWRVWLLVAGRGFGKTRAGAEWVLQQARDHPGARIALIGGSLAEAASVMIHGESGIATCAPSDERLTWKPSVRELHFPSGAVAHVYSGANPARLRGPQHHFAWADEIAKWRKPEESWHMLTMGMRLGRRPRTLVTTTPGKGHLLKLIAAMTDCATSGGRTFDNPHLPAAFVEAMRAQYGGTRLGRQELDGEQLGESEGALWTRDVIEACRVRPAKPEDDLQRVVIGIDPPAKAGGDRCGIIVCGMSDDGVALVLADCSVGGKRPEGWARVAAEAAEQWRADRLIAEANNGGDMVTSVLRSVAPNLPVRIVHASRGKAARAEPIAAAFEAGRCRFAGHFPELEDELTALTPAGYDGHRSPDRADAMVWALTELLRTPKREPRVVGL